MVDDFCHSRLQKEQHPGPDASLSPSEVVTLAIFARWARFTSERDFYRYASARLIDAFPTLCPTALSSTGWYAIVWASSRG
jgi:hypothetical protein